MTDEQHTSFQTRNSLESKDEFELPPMNRMKEERNPWDNIRSSTQQQQQQQQHQEQPTGKNGLTYEDLRKRTRIGFNKRTDENRDLQTAETEVNFLNFHPKNSTVFSIRIRGLVIRH